jgi:hypothetical protein
MKRLDFLEPVLTLLEDNIEANRSFPIELAQIRAAVMQRDERGF